MGRALVSGEEMMSPVGYCPWLGSLHGVPFTALTLFIELHEGHQPLSPKGSFPQQMMEENGKLANISQPGKWSLKRRCWRDKE